MKKKYKILNLDCAHCAAKIQENICKIDGVNEASVNFIMQKLTLDAEDERFEEILEAVKKEAKKVEPLCEIE